MKDYHNVTFVRTAWRYFDELDAILGFQLLRDACIKCNKYDIDGDMVNALNFMYSEIAMLT